MSHWSWKHKTPPSSLYFRIVSPTNSQLFTKGPLFPNLSLIFNSPIDCPLNLHQLHQSIIVLEPKQNFPNRTLAHSLSSRSAQLPLNLVMAIYDSMTPFEEENEPVSPSFKLSRLEHSKHTSKPPISPDSRYFDVSAAWYNHPGPVESQTTELMTPHPVLLRHYQTVNPLTPHPILLRNEVPQPIHHPSSGSSISQGDENHAHCSSCGLLRAQSGSVPEERCWHICADIARERECPDTQSPSSASIAEARCHESSKHRHRRHSLFYEPSPTTTYNGMEALQQDLTPRGQESVELDTAPPQLEEEGTPLEAESTILEEESTLLDQESTPLERAHDYEDPYYLGAEERLSRQTVKHEERKTHYRAQKTRKQVWSEGARASSDMVLEESKNETGTGQDKDHPKVITEASNHEYYYGKYI